METRVSSYPGITRRLLEDFKPKLDSLVLESPKCYEYTQIQASIYPPQELNEAIILVFKKLFFKTSWPVGIVDRATALHARGSRLESR